MSENKQKVVVSLPILGLLGIVFITLKLTGHITWSWLWVLAPFWGGIALGLALLLMIVLFAGIAAVVGHYLDKRAQKTVNKWRR